MTRLIAILTLQLTDAARVNSMSSVCSHECGARMVTENFFGEELTFPLGDGDNVRYEATENTCLAQCVVLRKGKIWSPACTPHLAGSVKVSAIGTRRGNFKLCCTTASCPVTKPVPEELETDPEELETDPDVPETDEWEKLPADSGYNCMEGQGDAGGSKISEMAANSFEACSAECEKETECVAFDYTADVRSGHFEGISWQHDACRLYSTRKFRKDGGLQWRQFCRKVSEELAEEEEDPDVNLVPKKKKAAKQAAEKPEEEEPETEEMPRLVGAPAAEGHCQYPCGESVVEAFYESSDVMAFTIGDGVSYVPSDAECLGNCKVVSKGVVFHSSCDGALPGSTKVSATDNFKLCCVPLSCPATTSTTTESTTPSLEAKFDCQPGQGKEATTYSETADNSFEACAARCDNDTQCAAFDYTLDADNGHLEIFAGTGWVHDACRLYTTKDFRASVGLAQRQVCLKTAEEAEPEMPEPEPEMPQPKPEMPRPKKRKAQPTRDVTAEEKLPRSVGAAVAAKDNVCQHSCGAASVDAKVAETGEDMTFMIGYGQRVSYRASEGECLGACQVVHKSFIHSSCGSALPGSEKVSTMDNFKLCCVPLSCPTTTSTTTESTTPSLEAKFSCNAGQGKTATTYSETADNSFEACAERCDNDTRCAAFDYSLIADNGHWELLTDKNVWTYDACRLYTSTAFRTGGGLAKRQFCSKDGMFLPEPVLDEPTMEELPALVGAPVTAEKGICGYECGLTSLKAKLSSGKEVVFTVGKGDRVTYSPTKPECFETCQPVAKGVLHESCEGALPGSTKVSATDKYKLCCVPLSCPATTSTTTTSTTPSLEAKFDCKPGQGKAFTTYSVSGNDSFEACARLCDDDTKCVSFDYSLNANAGHLELFRGQGWLADACRLYDKSQFRPSVGFDKREFCLKRQLDQAA